MDIVLKKYDSPCGILIMGAYGEQLCLCDWADDCGQPRQLVVNRLRRLLNAGFVWGESDTIDIAVAQLKEYFCGQRKSFDVPLLYPGTDFQRAVWEELLRIPYGETRSYAQQAAAIGRPRAVRAVASANRANAISIIIPCHRIIGSDKALTGYAGGLDAKQLLLNIETPKL